MLTEMLKKVKKRRKIKVFERCYSGFDSRTGHQKAESREALSFLVFLYISMLSGFMENAYV